MPRKPHKDIGIFIPIYCQKNIDVSLTPRERNVLHRIIVFDHLTTKFF